MCDFRRGCILGKFDPIKFKMAAYRPLFTFTSGLEIKGCPWHPKCATGTLKYWNACPAGTQKNGYKNIDFCTFFRLIQLWWFLVFSYFLLQTWARVIKAFSVEFNTGRGIASLAPNCRTEKFHWATVACIAVNIVFREFFVWDSQPWYKAPRPSNHW